MTRACLGAAILLATVVAPALAQAQGPPPNPGIPQRLSALEATVEALQEVVDSQAAATADLQKLVNAQDDVLRTMMSRVDKLQEAEVQKLNQYLSVSAGRKPLILFHDVNVQIVSGQGSVACQ